VTISFSNNVPHHGVSMITEVTGSNLERDDREGFIVVILSPLRWLDNILISATAYMIYTLQCNVKLFLCLTLRNEYVWGSGGMAPHVLNLGNRWKWLISFTPQPPRYPF